MGRRLDRNQSIFSVRRTGTTLAAASYPAGDVERAKKWGVEIVERLLSAFTEQVSWQSWLGG